MDLFPSKRLRVGCLVAASALTVWAGLGALGDGSGYTDALFEPDYTLLHVPPGGPLAEAGFQVGDSVIRVEGIPVVALGMYSRWPRSLSRRPGESITMVVEREGARVSGQVVYRERPPGSRRMWMGAFLVGLSFLWFGVWALYSAPSQHSLTLASIGLATGLAIPSLDLGSWNGVRDGVQVAAMILWTLLLLRFFLLFPDPKKVTTRRGFWVVLSLPWVAVLACVGVELAYHPRFYHTFGSFYGLLMSGYALLALVAFGHTLVKTPRDRMRATGMGAVLTGVAVGVGGVALWMVLALLPAISVPGSGWLPVLLGAIPAGMAVGTRRRVSSAGDFDA